MTIQEVINRVKAIKSPTPPDGDLLEMINDTEYEIVRKIIAPRDDAYEFDGYDDTDINTRLKAPRPFDNIYVIGCLREIDRRENQITNFNNDEREYKELLQEYGAWYVRTHRQCSPRIRSDWYGV